MATPAKSASPKKTTSSLQGSKKEEASCFEFKFDARSKPLTQNMLDLEAKRQKRFLSKKTKYPISHILVLLDKKTPSKGLINPLAQCIFFYKKNENEGARFIEALARLILDAASQEKHDFGHQKYLLYQALDTFSIGVQQSEKRISVSCQSMMVAILKILTPINSSGFEIEKEIQKLVTKMVTKKDLNNLEIRDKIIKLNMQGKRYYEAMYNLIEFEKLMKIRSRTMYVIKAGEINFRKANIFQQMIDFYDGVASGGGEKDQITDLGKLRSFIFRFNMDNSRFKLTPLKGTGPLAVNKTLGSLITVANTFYTEAGNNARFNFRHKAYYCMAHNNITTERYKSAINNLTAGLEALAKSNLKAIEKGNEKLQLLEQLVQLHKEHGVPRKAQEFTKELQDLRNSVRQMESKQREEKDKKAKDAP